VELILPNSLAPEIVSYLSAAHYFLGNKSKAQLYITALFEVSKDVIVNVDEFPPDIVDLYEEARRSRLNAQSVRLIEFLPKTAKLRHLGFEKEIIKGEKKAISLPLDSPLLRSQPIVFEAEGYAPKTYLMNELPAEVKLQSLDDRRLSTNGQLKARLESLDSDLILFADVTRDLNKSYIMKAQWLEWPSDKRSEAVYIEAASLSSMIVEAQAKLLALLTPDGRIRSLERAALANSIAHPGLAREKAPFYEKWWFWTAVGVGVAGLGVGGYFLLKPEDKLRFAVRAQN
jgi:hypothetical protein